MPRDSTSRRDELLIALQWDRGRWIWLLCIVVALDCVLGLGDSVAGLLKYDRAAIAGGGWWRLLTAHLVHLDWHHLLLNELGLVLVWALFAEDYEADEWGLIVGVGALAISAGLWWFSPHVVWYVGASGLLHTVMGAGVAQHLARGLWDRWLLLVIIVVKLAYEQSGGREPPLVVVDAHLYGALAGFGVGALLSSRRAIIRVR